MGLRRLGLRDFRCFSSVELSFSADAILIHGANASGKTSLLEAIFYLAQGRSFRTANPVSLVREGASGFQITGRVSQEGREIPLGVRRTGREQVLRREGVNARGWAEMARLLPVQLIDSEVHRLLDDGPRYRRRYLDWGVFHVEHRFLDCWRRYHRSLRQRNQALKARAADRELTAWDRDLAAAGERLNTYRAEYLRLLAPLVEALAQQVLLCRSLQLQLRPGWPEGLSLAEALAQAGPRDHQHGQTHAGPHRAELRVLVDGHPAQERISRGQHKLLAAVMILAQGRVLAAVRRGEPVLLLDDIAAELDREHLGRFLALLEDQPGQRIMTAITPAALPKAAVRGTALFHVEHGRVAAG